MKNRFITVLLTLIAAITLGSCSSINRFMWAAPIEAKDAHAGEAKMAEAIHNKQLAVIEKVTDPDARLLLYADAQDDWSKFSQLHAATAKAMDSPPVVSAEQATSLGALVKEIIAAKKQKQ